MLLGNWMNNYDFFIELNNYLGFNFDGPLKLVGNIKGPKLVHWNNSEE